MRSHERGDPAVRTIEISQVDGDVRIRGSPAAALATAGRVSAAVSDLDHANGRSLQSLRGWAWISLIAIGPECCLDCELPFLRHGDSQVSDPEREPSGVKMAPKAVVGRVSLYLRQLETYQRQGIQTVSSSQLGEPLSIKNAQVRKDLAFFGSSAIRASATGSKS